MALAEKIYEWLASGPTPAADRALGDAFKRAEPAYVERLARCLIQRHTEAAWTALVSRFGDLPEDMRARVKSDSDLVMAGITSAMKSSVVETRLNALEAYASVPTERLSHLLTPALRDSSLPVRTRAAEVLRAVAIQTHSSWTRMAQSSDAEEAREVEQGVAMLVDTLRSVLRSIDIHHRVEAVEPCLWFCEPLGVELWQAIDKPRSRVAFVINERLSEWNDARLAPFLLRAAAHPEWRREAHKLLADWKTRDELAALLRHTSLLDEADIRRGLLGVRNAKWFAKATWELTELPEALRPHAPAWVCAGGFSERERVAYLTRWSRAVETPLARAAKRALGALGQTVATGGGRRTHTGSYVRSDTAHPASDPPSVAARAEARPPVAPDDKTDDARVGEFALLWQLCRRTPPSDNGELVSLFLEHIQTWGHRLATLACSPDARDRILTMQIIRAGGLTDRFRPQLERLQHDPVEGLRKLATAMLETPSPPPAPRPAVAPRPDAPAADENAMQEARDSLKTIIAELIKRDDLHAEESVMLMSELKSRLRQLYGQEQAEGAPQPVKEQV